MGLPHPTAMLRTTFLAGLLFQTLVSFCQAPTTGTIKGHVTDATTGQPLPNVNVILMKEGQILTAQGTSANGNYLYEKLYPNTFDVVFAVKGRKLENREVKGVEVQAGMITTLNVAIGETDITADPITIVPDPKTNPLALAIVIPVDKKSDEEKEEFKGQYYPFIPEQDWVFTSEQPGSSFSSDVDDAFYTIVRRMIQHRVEPPAGAVRIEEMINYFDYDYPLPSEGDFSVYTEVARCPWQREHLLLHIGVQARELIDQSLPPSHFVFLMDVSGSMTSSDKLPLAKSSMRTLVKQLRDKDRVTIVTYRDDMQVVIENIPGSDKPTILKALAGMYADGYTAGAPGLIKAYDLAERYRIKDGNNRVILCSDGDFNVGPSSDEELLALIEKKRKSGVYLTVLGFGMDNLQDGKLELLADKGNGNYGYISTISEAEKILVNEMGATLQAVARDVKVQTTFDETFVKAYRLIGYENRMLTDKEYEKRRTDAGEVGVGQAFTALYEIIPGDEIGIREGEMGQFEITYKSADKTNHRTKNLQRSIAFSEADYTAASESFRFAAAVAEFGLLIRNSNYRYAASLEQAYQLAEGAVGKDRFGYRADFLEMITQYRKLTGH